MVYAGEKFIVLKRGKKQITSSPSVIEHCGILFSSVLNTSSEKLQHFLQGCQDNPVHPNTAIVLITTESLQIRNKR
jgi:hypothetical protein